MRLSMRPTILLATLITVLLAGCTTPREREPIAKSLQLDSPKLARGEKAFMHYCDKCHPRGDAGLGPGIRNKPLPGVMIKLQVRTGLGAMPSFSDELLPDDQLDDIVAYIKELKKQ
jgi:mono/diheme cytochrome c family protein